MPGFRYAQLCPLARAAEVLGERWTLLVIRELFCGPQRFSDLRRRLPGLSSSVLSDRLQRLEARGVVRRRVLQPPAASVVYELDEAGRALEEPLLELMRWGMRWLVPSAGDHLEPDWVGLGLRAFARREATPERSFEVRIQSNLDEGETALRLFVRGGSDGAHVGREAGPVDLMIEAPAFQMLGLASGAVPGHPLVEAGLVRAEGDLAALKDFPELFRFEPERRAPAETTP